MPKNTIMFRKYGVGTVKVSQLRPPLSWLVKNPLRFYFQPEFDGAGWYEIDREVAFSDEFTSLPDAFAAMFFLRSHYQDLPNRMVKF